MGCVEAEFLRKRIGDGVADTASKNWLWRARSSSLLVSRELALLAEKNEHVVVPQQLPLSAGIPGCTSPRLPEDVDALVFVADGALPLWNRS